MHRKHHQIQTSILVSAELVADLDAVAAADGISRADVIRGWLRIGAAVEHERIRRARRNGGESAA